MDILALNTQNLGKLADRLPVPNYDRSILKAGIVHIGVGGFHRSHQAYYIHQLLQKHSAADWAICGVGLREDDRRIADVLKKQDCLYTLVTQHPKGKVDSEVLGSIIDYLLAVDDPQLVINRMAHPDTKIVSLTITEGGYNFNPNTGEFDFENLDIQHDLNNLSLPKTIYGYLMAALRNRYESGQPPFTILSCDNIQHNGDMLRKMVLAFAERQDKKMVDWIAEKVDFPNSMVDRITPTTTALATDYLLSTYQLSDEWCVVCEPFIQWVIEDKFSNGRPPLEKLGVQFVPDVTPYEKMKIRLLNAGHSVLGIPGAIFGHSTIDDCMNDSVFANFLRKFMDKDVTPILGKIEGIDMEKYKDTIEVRFANPNIKDGVARICSESAAKLPKFLIQTLRENLKNGGSIKYATFILAAWCYYSDKGINEKGEALVIIDVKKEQLHQAASNTTSDWTSFLNQTDLFENLNKNERFVNEYTRIIQAIYKENDIRKLMNELYSF